MSDDQVGGKSATVESAKQCSEEPKKEEMYVPAENSEQTGGDSAASRDYECHPEQLKKIKDLISQYNKVTVMVAGKPKVGKSTVFNNLFGLNLKTGPGASSVTTAVVLDETISYNGVQIRYVDVPGVQALDMDSEKILEGISSKIGEGDDHFTLLYCVSVLIGYTEDDEMTVKKLTDRFGANIWNRCILVVTNCDAIRNENFPEEKEDKYYRELLIFYTKVFKNILKKFSSCEIPVELIYDCQDDVRRPGVSGVPDGKAVPDGKVVPDGKAVTDGKAVPDGKAMPDGKVKCNTIVTVPVAKSREHGRKPNILPGIELADNTDWSDYVFVEILKKSGKFSPALIQLRYNVLGNLRAAGVGAAAGAVAGLAEGPIATLAGVVEERLLAYI